MLTDFNELGVCTTPEVVAVNNLPRYYAAEVRLAVAPDGTWRHGYEYEGPPVGVGLRGRFPVVQGPAAPSRVAALAAGSLELAKALALRPRARHAASAVRNWRKRTLKVLRTAATGGGR